jgi:putative tryptophan/tyrosine transport system substrate-binding protein
MQIANGRWRMVKPISDLPLLISGSCALLFVLSVFADAQQPTKIHRVGFLGTEAREQMDAVGRVLRELGYIEGKNVIYEFRAGRGNEPERYADFAAELARLKVEVIVAGGAGAVRAAKNASATIPIVMGVVNDPVALGYVASLAHPGGNITGISNLSPELSGKRLELVKEVIPKATRVAVLAYRGAAMRTSIKETEDAGPFLKIKLQLLEISAPDQLESLFDAAKKDRADALVQIEANFLAPYQRRIIDLAAKNRLPAMFNNHVNVEAGGLMSYGPDPTGMNRQIALIVDKILKGRKPAEIPVEQPKKFEFAINLQAAKQIGLTIPLNVLARADRVIR